MTTEKVTIKVFAIDDPECPASQSHIDTMMNKYRAILYYEKGEFWVWTTTAFSKRAIRWANDCVDRLLAGIGTDFFKVGEDAPACAVFGMDRIPRGIDLLETSPLQDR